MADGLCVALASVTRPVAWPIDLQRDKLLRHASEGQVLETAPVYNLSLSETHSRRGDCDLRLGSRGNDLSLTANRRDLRGLGSNNLSLSSNNLSLNVALGEWC